MTPNLMNSYVFGDDCFAHTGILAKLSSSVPGFGRCRNSSKLTQIRSGLFEPVCGHWAGFLLAWFSPV